MQGELKHPSRHEGVNERSGQGQQRQAGVAPQQAEGAQHGQDRGQQHDRVVGGDHGRSSELVRSGSGPAAPLTRSRNGSRRCSALSMTTWLTCMVWRASFPGNDPAGGAASWPCWIPGNRTDQSCPMCSASGQVTTTLSDAATTTAASHQATEACRAGDGSAAGGGEAGSCRVSPVTEAIETAGYTRSRNVSREALWVLG